MEQYLAIVEQAISMLNVPVDAAKSPDKPGQYSLKKDNINVWIDVWHIETEGRAYFQVMAPIFQLNEGLPKEFYKEILEINDRLFGVAFSIFNNWLYIKVIRECEGLDANEAYASIVRVGNYASSHEITIRQKWFSNGGQAPIV